MKLLTKYNRVNLLATIIVLLLSGGGYYLIIRSVLLHQLDKTLKVEEQEVTDYIAMNNALPNTSKYRDQLVEFSLAQEDSVKRIFTSYTELDTLENEVDARRKLIFPVMVNGKNYKASISKSQVETEDLLEYIIMITLAVVMALLLILFTVNRLLLNKLWHPFYTTLQALKQFNFSKTNGLQLAQTNTTEFNDLNHAVTAMTNRVSADYQSLKNFTENASHEIQTPLAIINSKLDLLIQDEAANEQQMKNLQGIYDAVTRLTKLNKSLLLLTKIENHQFGETENISLDIMIQEKLLQLDELVQQKNLQVKTALDTITIACNKELAEMLTGNLLSNAIRYNIVQGSIAIQLDKNMLRISNTSLVPALDSQMVFSRFYRHSETIQEGNGLGLSIVKQICDVAGYKLMYEHHDGQHVFSIFF